MRKKLFQYALVWHPTEKQVEAGAKSKLIGNIETTMAKDEKEVLIMAAKAIPDEYSTKGELDQVEIAVRPF